MFFRCKKSSRPQKRIKAPKQPKKKLMKPKFLMLTKRDNSICSVQMHLIGQGITDAINLP